MVFICIITSSCKSDVGELFHYNRNVHNVSRYKKPNFLPAPHLKWYIDSQIPGKGFLMVFKKSNKGRRKFLFL